MVRFEILSGYKPIYRVWHGNGVPECNAFEIIGPDLEISEKLKCQGYEKSNTIIRNIDHVSFSLRYYGSKRETG